MSFLVDRVFANDFIHKKELKLFKSVTHDRVGTFGPPGPEVTKQYNPIEDSTRPLFLQAMPSVVRLLGLFKQLKIGGQ
jgi:hypothetical protein